MSDISGTSRDGRIQADAARKGLYLLPSMFTAGNMAAGYYAISQAIQGTAADPWHFDHAAKAIGFAIVFDFFDGGIARLTNTASAFGRELDSLADVIAFGVAPAVLAWMWGFRMLPLDGDPDCASARAFNWAAIATFVFLLAGASRLARFNIQVNPQPSNPGPPGTQVFCRHADSGGRGRGGRGGPPGATAIRCRSGGCSIGWGVFVFAISFLMVSTWRFFSLKGINFRQPQNFRWLIVTGRADCADLVFFAICSVRAGADLYSFGSAGAAFVSYSAGPRCRLLRRKTRPRTPDEK